MTSNYPEWAQKWADFYHIPVSQLMQNIQAGQLPQQGSTGEYQTPLLGSDINPDTGRRWIDSQINPSGTYQGDLSSQGQWQLAPESMQHGPNNFMERLASYSPYIIGAMAGYGALGASGAFGANAAGGVGAGAAAPGEAAGAFTGSFPSGYAGAAGGAGGLMGPSAEYAGAAGAAAPAAGVGGAAPAAAAPASSGLFGSGGISGAASAIQPYLPLLGAVGGALQGGQDQTATNTTHGDPALAPLQQSLINQSIVAASQPFQRGPGFNPDQQAAFQQIRDQQNSPLMQAGSDALIRQMQPGDNPYLQGVVDKSSADIAKQFNNTVVPNLDAMNTRANTGFGTSSAINGGQPDSLRQNAYTSLNDTTANAANNLRYQDYGAQQNRSLQAAGMVPGYNAMNTGNTQALLNVGNQQQGFDYQEFMRQQQYPEQQMRLLGYPFGFPQGGSSTQSTPGVGPWTGAISGLLGGVGMGNTLGQTPPPANPMMGQTYGAPTYPQSYPPGYTTPWGTP